MRFFSICIILLLFVPIFLYPNNSYFKEGGVILFAKETPLVFTKIIFKGGNLFDTKGGETYLLSKILTMSSLTNTLEEVGTTLKIEVDYDSFSIEYEILSEYHAKTLKKVFEFLSSYQINKNDFELAKEQLMQELKIQEDAYYNKVRLKFYEILYSNHRYAKPITGNFQSIKSIQINDLVDTFKKLINKEQMKLILVGKVNKNDSNYYQKVQSIIPTVSEHYQKTQLLNNIKKDSEVVINAPSTQVFVRIGTLGITRSDPDYLYYTVISDIIGGGFGSMITQKLREEAGLTYSSVANFYALRKDRGYFFISYSTRNENLAKSLAMIKNIFNILKKEGISKKNLTLSRQYIYGVLLQREETNESVADLIAEQEVFDLPELFWEKDKNNLLKINYIKINKIVKKFFKNKHFIYVILKNQGK